MKLNGSKFEHLAYGKNKELKMNSTYLNNDCKKIKNEESVRDLGIIMSSDCSFKQHISKVISRANSICAWILL